ncbi:hypothetical protein [Pyrobaculum neutrophilum]|uniref:Uncharacterized protein n=1 Tax=Pyrobaculum neutrophilum (strain DSM 2338 / JCM 9278 / NBRC 100436 / V24Sta) TaxID=444157 RepID=B1YA97_PYRNV|nr:hypothetical protein [Pyrobaculum neutrophilum]ACB39071.1 conserved hypothetical protein [Pyrobaculum neutrophilum V24Sta]
MRGLESVELVVTVALLLAFVGGTYYFFTWVSDFSKQQQLQADLSAQAQNVLDRIIYYRPYNPLKELGVGLDGRYVDDRYIALYALAAGGRPPGQTCTIQSQALASAVGTSQATLVGRGWLYVDPQQLSLDYVDIVKDLFGSVAPDGVTPLYNKYDLWLTITPVVNATCSINNDGTASLQLFTTYGRRPVDGKVVYTILYAAPSGSSGVLCSKTGVGYTQGGTLVVKWQDQLTCDPQGTVVPDTNTGTLVVIFEKIDRPATLCYAVAGKQRPLAYGFVLPTSSGPVLYIAHDATVSCGSGNLPALGVRYVDLFWGGSRYRVASDVTLDPGVGRGRVKVDRCSACTGSSQCAACYIDGIPPAAKLAVIYVERNSQGQSDQTPLVDLIVVPVAPYPPLMRVDVRTWLRWGFVNTPQVYSAVATRVVDSPTSTYNFTLVLYRWP